MTLRITEYRSWSPVLGCDTVRVSMFNGRGHEYFMLLPEESGRAWREKRIEAAETINLAIRQGLPPGEVRVVQ